MLSSPITLTLATVDSDYHKVLEEGAATSYATENGALQFKVSHQKSGKRTRRMARIDRTLTAEDPFSSVSVSQKAGVYLVIDEPEFGFTSAQLENLVDALTLWLTTDNITAMLSGRH